MRLLANTRFAIHFERWINIICFCFLVALLLCCSRSTDTKDTATSTTDEESYDKVSFKTFDVRQHDVCKLKMLEFTDIYEPQGLPEVDKNIHGYDSLVFAHMPYDSIAIERMLKDKGLSMVNMRWGKWSGGPKIACLTYADNNYDCCCHVDKVYYATGQENEYIVTERIDCFGPSGLTALNLQTGKHVID